MAQTSLPEALLWAAQLKREHTFLLERIRKIEIGMQRIEAITESSESCREAISELAAAVEQTRERFDLNSSEMMDTTLKPLSDRVKLLTKDTEELNARVATLQGYHSGIDDERKRALAEEKSLLRRILGLEERQSKYEEGVEMLRDEMSHSRDQGTQTANDRVEKLLGEVNREQRLKRLMSTKMDTLEATQTGLLHNYTLLKEDVEKLATKQPSPANRLGTQHLDLTNNTPRPLTKPAANQTANPRRKSRAPAPMTVTMVDADSIATRLRPRRQMKIKEPPVGCGGKVALSSKKRKVEYQNTNSHMFSHLQRETTSTFQLDEQDLERLETRRRVGTEIPSSSLSSPPASLSLRPRSLSRSAAPASIGQGQTAKVQTGDMLPSAQTQPPPRRRRRIEQTCELPVVNMF